MIEGAGEGPKDSSFLCWGVEGVLVVVVTLVVVVARGVVR